MSTPEAIIREWFEQLWNRRDVSVIDRILAPEGLVHGLTPQPIDRTGLKSFYAAFAEAFPDLHIDLLRTVTEGDTVAAHIAATGTHRGGSLGISPTGRAVRIEGMVMAQVVDGRVIHSWNSIDFLALYQQLGVVGNPVAP